MNFHAVEIPVASSMTSLARMAEHPFQKYFCYWAAFNNIYKQIAARQGNSVRLNMDNNTGLPKVVNIGSYTFPRVIVPREGDLIDNAINELTIEFRNELISHPNISFFVERLPRGVMSRYDNEGQFINGVLNVTKTIDQNYPVWSPIDKIAYDRYMKGDISEQNLLAKQIVFMLYVIRNNLVHGGKNPTEANDIYVVENAFPLLVHVVGSFFRDERY